MTPAPPCSIDAVVSAALAVIRRSIPLTETDETGIGNALVSPVRAALIRAEYNAGRINGVKSEALIVELAERYCLGYEAVYSIVHFRR